MTAVILPVFLEELKILHKNTKKTFVVIVSIP